MCSLYLHLDIPLATLRSIVVDDLKIKKKMDPTSNRTNWHLVLVSLWRETTSDKKKHGGCLTGCDRVRKWSVTGFREMSMSRIGQDFDCKLQLVYFQKGNILTHENERARQNYLQNKSIKLSFWNLTFFEMHECFCLSVCNRQSSEEFVQSDQGFEKRIIQKL